MLTSRYHIASILAIFIALGIGILIGGTLGQQWVNSTENQFMHLLMEKYEQQVTANIRLQKQLGSMQLLHQALSPNMGDKSFVWLRPSGMQSDMLSAVMSTSGAQWSEADSEPLKGEHAQRWLQSLSADYIVISDPALIADMNERWTGEEEAELEDPPVMVDISGFGFKLQEPGGVAQFVLLMRRLAEEESEHAAVHYRYYPGLE